VYKYRNVESAPKHWLVLSKWKYLKLSRDIIRWQSTSGLQLTSAGSILHVNQLKAVISATILYGERSTSAVNHEWRINPETP